MCLWNQQAVVNWKPVFGGHALTEACLHHSQQGFQQSKDWAGEAPSLGNRKIAPSPKALGCSLMMLSTVPLLISSVQKGSEALTTEIQPLCLALFQAWGRCAGCSKDCSGGTSLNENVLSPLQNIQSTHWNDFATLSVTKSCFVLPKCQTF